MFRAGLIGKRNCLRPELQHEVSGPYAVLGFVKT